ncbi:hypothetical protein AArcCO_4068 (plasmid) [Halalkaliarchaeum sp. AArc-CO]|nr:hypothetical protein AArcCO_4068 [Halalkaliarchaeum sp. AArc-CO]
MCTGRPALGLSLMCWEDARHHKTSEDPSIRSPDLGLQKTRSTQRRFVSGRHSVGTSRSRTPPPRSAMPSNSSAPVIAQSAIAVMPE